MRANLNVLEFIRRFPDSNWMNGNCYYFALILKDKFKGRIVYDVINGHFLTVINGLAYDYEGAHSIQSRMIDWETFEESYDSLQYKVIVRDCL